jgi:hypothetical protein
LHLVAAGILLLLRRTLISHIQGTARLYSEAMGHKLSHDSTSPSDSPALEDVHWRHSALTSLDP